MELNESEEGISESITIVSDGTKEEVKSSGDYMHVEVQAGRPEMDGVRAGGLGHTPGKSSEWRTNINAFSKRNERECYTTLIEELIRNCRPHTQRMIEFQRHVVHKIVHLLLQYYVFDVICSLV